MGEPEEVLQTSEEDSLFVFLDAGPGTDLRPRTLFRVVENYAKIVDNLASNVGNLLQTESVSIVDAPSAAPMT